MKFFLFFVLGILTVGVRAQKERNTHLKEEYNQDLHEQYLLLQQKQEQLQMNKELQKLGLGDIFTSSHEEDPEDQFDDELIGCSIEPEVEIKCPDEKVYTYEVQYVTDSSIIYDPFLAKSITPPMSGCYLSLDEKSIICLGRGAYLLSSKENDSTLRINTKSDLNNGTDTIPQESKEAGHE